MKAMTISDMNGTILRVVSCPEIMASSGYAPLVLEIVVVVGVGPTVNAAELEELVW